jgi:hypothetical protein
MTQNKTHQDSAAILIKKLREDLNGAGRELGELINSAEDFSLVKSKTQMELGLEEVISRSMTMPHDPVPSQRFLLGPLVTFLKKIILRLGRPFFSMTLSEQIEFNENVGAQLKLVHESLNRLTQEIDSLRREFEAHRLKAISKNPENEKAQ